MRLFGKERETLRVAKVQASRAIFIDLDHQEVEIKLRTEDGEELTLRLPPRIVPDVIQQLALAHEAINPPTFRGNAAAGWNGMD